MNHNEEEVHLKAGIINTIQKNGKFYLMEAIGIGGFVLLAGAITTFLEHPSLPVMKSGLSEYPFIRRAMLGIALGIYVALTIKWFGKLSGTHVNPSVTCTFCRLGNIRFIDAAGYILSQFIGAVIAFYILKWMLGNWFAYPSINYGISKPEPPHTLTQSFIAEFIISSILMATVLILSSSRKGEKYMAVSIGILIALFIIFELPYSGMSMNPARSFAAAFGTNQWDGLWVYFVSPTLAMIMLAELFIIWRRKRVNAAHPDHKDIGMYPLKKT